MICREKILRLKQHHKKSHKSPRESQNNVVASNITITDDLINVGNEVEASKCSNPKLNPSVDENGHGIGFQSGVEQQEVGYKPRLPNSASNYSINNSRLSASSSNQSFASGLV